MTKTGMRNGASSRRRWSYSAGFSLPTKSPVITTMSGGGWGVAVGGPAAFAPGAQPVAQHQEIAACAEVDVGRVVPMVVRQLRFRHLAVKQQAEADAPEAEIGERHDRPLADAQQRFHHVTRL